MGLPMQPNLPLTPSEREALVARLTGIGVWPTRSLAEAVKLATPLQASTPLRRNPKSGSARMPDLAGWPLGVGGVNSPGSSGVSEPIQIF